MANNRFEEVLAKYLLQIDSGEEVDHDRFLNEHPDVADELRAYFADVDAFQQLAQKETGRLGSTASIQIEPPKLFGKYELLERIARGGMGIVYRAYQMNLDRTVAIKVLAPERWENQSDLLRLWAEAKAAAKLQHSGIIQIHDVDTADGWPYIAMEYVSGKNLAELIEDGPLEPRLAAEYTRKAAEAVHYAHKHAVLHRDIKPSNILLSDDKRLLVADFGLAKPLDSESGLTMSGAVVGTPSYMSPEQARGQRDRTGPASDVYSLGATLYELVSGRPPFRAATPLETLRQVMETEPVSPKLLNAAISKDLETICLKCLEKDPVTRYESANALSRDLERFLRGEPIEARPVGFVERTWRRARRKPLLTGLIAAVAVTTLVLAIGGPIAAAYMASLYQTSETRRIENGKLVQQRTILLAESEFDRANLAGQRGQWDVSMESLKQAKELGHPDPVAVELERIKSLQALGRADESRVAISALVGRRDLGQHKARATLLAGIEFFMDGNHTDAISTIQTAKQLGLTGADEAFAEALLADDATSAVKLLEKTVELDPFHHQANGQLVLSLLLLGRREAAMNRADALTYLYPQDPTFPVAAALIAAFDDDTEKRNHYLARVDQILDDTTVSTALTGLCDDIAQLNRSFDNGISGVPAKMLLLIPKNAWRLAKLRGASISFRAPPAMMKGYVSLIPTLGLTLLPGGRKRAIETLENLVKTHPEGTFYFILAELYDQEADFVKTRDAFVAAAEAPSMFPAIKGEALHAAAVYEASLLFKGQPQDLTQPVKRLHERRMMGPFLPHQFHTAYAISKSGHAYGLAALILDDMLAEKGEDGHLERAKLELEAGHFASAIDYADKALQSKLDENDAAALRIDAVEKMRKFLATNSIPIEPSQ